MPYSRYYRSRLTKPESEAYDSTVCGLERMEADIPFPAGARQSLDKIIFAVKYDNPQLFYVDYALRLTYTDAEAVLYAAYRCGREEMQAMRSRIEEEAKAIVKGTAGKTMAEKALYLHDRLVRRCSYGVKAGREAHAHTIAGAFLDNVCVCEGYSMAFKYLADQVGLRCMTIAGSGIHPDGSRGPHAWNLVMIDGKTSYIDVTFDSLLEGRYCSHAYFCVSDPEILVDHSFDARFPIPPCRYGQSFLPVVSGTDQLISFMRAEAQRGASFSQVRLTKGFTSDELIEKVHRKLTVADYGWYRRLGSYSYANNCRVLSLIWK